MQWTIRALSVSLGLFACGSPASDPVGVEDSQLAQVSCSSVVTSTTTERRCTLPASLSVVDLRDVAAVAGANGEGWTMSVEARGGAGGDFVTASGAARGGAAGSARLDTTLEEFNDAFGGTVLYYYLGEDGADGSSDGSVEGTIGAGGGASTVVTVADASIESLRVGNDGNVVLIAGGGGGAGIGDGGSSVVLLHAGGDGGSATASGTVPAGPGWDATGGSGGVGGIGPIGSSERTAGGEGIGGRGGGGGGALGSLVAGWKNEHPSMVTATAGNGGWGEDHDASPANVPGGGGGGGYGGGGGGISGGGGGSYVTNATASEAQATETPSAIVDSGNATVAAAISASTSGSVAVSFSSDTTSSIECPKVVVFDIDGTITPDDAQVEYALLGYDGYDPTMWTYAKDTIESYMDAGFQVVFLTGRPGEETFSADGEDATLVEAVLDAIEDNYKTYEDITEDWLNDRLSIPSGVSYDLITYPSSDNQSSSTIQAWKTEELEDYASDLGQDVSNIVSYAFSSSSSDITAYEDAGVDSSVTEETTDGDSAFDTWYDVDSNFSNPCDS